MNSIKESKKVVLVSYNTSRKEADEFEFNYGESIQWALDKTMRTEGEDVKVTVIPAGSLTVPIRA